MKERTESILLSIASAIMIAVVVMCVITNLRLANLNKRLDWQSERIEIIFDILESDGEIFDILNKKIDLKLDNPVALEGINTEDLTLPKHNGCMSFLDIFQNYPYRNEYQEGVE